MKSSNQILLTFDVEDWFQVENLRQCIFYSSWPSYELRVEKNTHRLLDLLDEASHKQSSVSQPRGLKQDPGAADLQLRDAAEPVTDDDKGKRLRATFFILGWIAERMPRLIREIHSRNHEVASHGYNHDICTEKSMEDLKKDLSKSKALLEDIIGDQVSGYRAPNFSINHEILKTIQDCGYLYDSSYNSFTKHHRYGHIDLGKNPKNGIASKISDKFYELPISNIKIGKRVIPWGGGGYFRLIPSLIFKLGVKSILSRQKTYLFYMHPWEIDDEQPRISGISKFYTFRHYVNLNKAKSKLSDFLESFSACKFLSCGQYLKNINACFSDLEENRDLC